MRRLIIISLKNYYPLFRVRSWNNGVRYVSFYILMSIGRLLLQSKWLFTSSHHYTLCCDRVILNDNHVRISLLFFISISIFVIEKCSKRIILDICKSNRSYVNRKPIENLLFVFHWGMNGGMSYGILCSVDYFLYEWLETHKLLIHRLYSHQVTERIECNVVIHPPTNIYLKAGNWALTDQWAIKCNCQI